MRGSDERSGSLFSYVDLEARVRRDHPLRAIRKIANAALTICRRHLLRSIWTLVDHRLHQKSCFVRCCCRRFTAFVPSAN